MNRFCRQPRYPGNKSRGPEVLRPRLTTGLPLSALGRLAAARHAEIGPTLRAVTSAVPLNRAVDHRPSLKRPRSMAGQTAPAIANLSLFGDRDGACEARIADSDAKNTRYVS